MHTISGKITNVFGIDTCRLTFYLNVFGHYNIFDRIMLPDVFRMGLCWLAGYPMLLARTLVCGRLSNVFSTDICCLAG
jgi:hypothetical protein